MRLMLPKYLVGSGLNKLALHKIDKPFDRVHTSDNVRGISYMFSAETLHALGNGIMKYQFACNNELIGPGQSKMKEKSL